MTNPQAVELNCITGEVTTRDLTPEEIAASELAKQEYDKMVAAADALTALKASAKAKLISGQPLTAEEADTLVI